MGLYSDVEQELLENRSETKSFGAGIMMKVLSTGDDCVRNKHVPLCDSCRHNLAIVVFKHALITEKIGEMVDRLRERGEEEMLEYASSGLWNDVLSDDFDKRHKVLFETFEEYLQGGDEDELVDRFLTELDGQIAKVEEMAADPDHRPKIKAQVFDAAVNVIWEQDEVIRSMRKVLNPEILESMLSDKLVCENDNDCVRKGRADFCDACRRRFLMAVKDHPVARHKILSMMRSKFNPNDFSEENKHWFENVNQGKLFSEESRWEMTEPFVTYCKSKGTADVEELEAKFFHLYLAQAEHLMNMALYPELRPKGFTKVRTRTSDGKAGERKESATARDVAKEFDKVLNRMKGNMPSN